MANTQQQQLACALIAGCLAGALASSLEGALVAGAFAGALVAVYFAGYFAVDFINLRQKNKKQYDGLVVGALVGAFVVALIDERQKRNMPSEDLEAKQSLVNITGQFLN